MFNAKPFILSLAFSLAAATCYSQGIFLEPYVGVGQMQIAVYDTTNKDYAIKDISSGFLLGIKGGYNFSPRFFAGLDYQTGGPFIFGRLASRGEWTVRMLGVGLGIDYDIARYWLGYYFDHSIDDSRNLYKYTGDAFKAGFGLKIAKNMHANLDIVIHTLKNVTASGKTTPISQLPQVQTVFVSISLPIDFK